MSNIALREVTGQAEPQQKPKTFPAMLHAYKDEIARALPKHINPDRMARVALTCFRQTPALADCSPASVFASVIQASQLGLEPGLNGRAYLIPYKGECTFVPGWKGLVELANRTGRSACWTGAVFDGDEFDYQLGDSPFVRHRPRGEDDPEKLLYVYAVGRIKGNDWPVVEVWPIGKILKHRNRYNKVGKSHYSYKEWEMYARKIPLLQVLKYLPASPELETALALNDAAEAGTGQGITLEGAIASTYDPPPPPADTAEDGADAPKSKTDSKPKSGDGGFVATYAQVRAALESAKTDDAKALARDMIRGVADETQRKELEEVARLLFDAPQ